jgi:hypothetical protein
MMKAPVKNTASMKAPAKRMVSNEEKRRRSINESAGRMNKKWRWRRSVDKSAGRMNKKWSWRRSIDVSAGRMDKKIEEAAQHRRKHRPNGWKKKIEEVDEFKLFHGAPLKNGLDGKIYDLSFTASLARWNLPDGTDDARRGNWESRMAVKRVPLS